MLICGAFLGSGMSRKVFASRTNADQVLKLESSSTFQNVMEWEVWSIARDCKQLSKWFAPCVEISTYGQWLIQKRTHPIEKRHLPKLVPTAFTDLKAANWGWLDGRVVCHDYGTIMCRLLNERSSKLRKADWY